MGLYVYICTYLCTQKDRPERKLIAKSKLPDVPGPEHHERFFAILVIAEEAHHLTDMKRAWAKGLGYVIIYHNPFMVYYDIYIYHGIL